MKLEQFQSFPKEFKFCFILQNLQLLPVHIDPLLDELILVALPNKTNFVTLDDFLVKKTFF